MQPEQKEKLMNAGIQIEDTLERCMGNEELVDRLLCKFFREPVFEEYLESVRAGDRDRFYKLAHTLKGTCGNLGMKAMADIFAKQVTLYREDRYEEALSYCGAAEEAYRRARQAAWEIFRWHQSGFSES